MHERDHSNSSIGRWRRMRRHLSFANIASGLSLFLVLSTGTAVALAGANTVFSDDIVDGQVISADLGAGAVTSSDLGANAVTGPKVLDRSIGAQDLYREPWHNVVANAEAANPLSHSDPCVDVKATGMFCGANYLTFYQGWQNYPGFQAARWQRDAVGYVHLQGLVQGGLAAVNFNPNNPTIFVLPAGFRPLHSQLFAVDCGSNPAGNVAHGRIEITAEGLVNSFLSGQCWAPNYVSLSGISFFAEH